MGHMNLEKFYDNYWRQKSEDHDVARIELVTGQIKRGERVLEIGGHIGLGAKMLMEKGADVTLTDISGVALDKAKKRGIKNVCKVNLDLDSLPFTDGSFDVVIANSSIEHIFYPHKMISESARVLKPQGRFIMLAPNIGHIRFRFWLLQGKFPYYDNTPTDQLHLRFLTLSEARKLCLRFGLKTEGIDGNAGLWVRALYPRILQRQPLKSIYTTMARSMPSMFARDFIITCRKVT
jgi:ubiquinone/menaquinone biosynthesis C-methylase UbiE